MFAFEISSRKIEWQKCLCSAAKKETEISDVLLKFGFREDFSVLRMFLGQSMARNCIYLAESLERG
jgi:hypothetical protein